MKRYSQLVPPREFSLSRLMICDCGYVGWYSGCSEGSCELGMLHESDIVQMLDLTSSLTLIYYCVNITFSLSLILVGPIRH